MGQLTELQAKQLAAELRANGVGHTQIALTLRRLYDGITARKAMRFAWGWSQAQACIEWEHRFNERKASKQFSYWENWPISGHAPSLETLDQLAQLYRCSVVDLLSDLPDYGAERPPAEPSPPPADAWPDSLPVAHRLQQPEMAGRSPLVRHTSDTLATVLDLLRPPDTSADDLASRVEVIRSGRSRIDGETLAGLAQITSGYRRAYRSAGAATLLGPAHGALQLLIDLAPEAGSDQVDNLVSMIGEMASLLGTVLMLDVGDFQAAKPYFSITAHAGQQIGSAELTALAMGCRAFHATYSGDLRSGLAFAEGALDIAAARSIAPRTHGWLAAVGSEMQATAHNELACGRLLDEAAAQLELAADDQEWLGIGAFNPDKLTAYRGGDLVRLGRFHDAQVLLHEALDRLDPALRKHRATACIDLADAYVRDGRIDDGAHHALAALEIVTGTRHADSIRRVEKMHRTIAPTRTSSVRLLGAKLIELQAAS